MDTHMIKEFLKDPWSYVGSLGVAMLAVVQWLAEHFNSLVAGAAGIGGLILIGIGIAEKYHKWQIAKQEHRMTKLEADRMEQNDKRQ